MCSVNFRFSTFLHFMLCVFFVIFFVRIDKKTDFARLNETTFCGKLSMNYIHKYMI